MPELDVNGTNHAPQVEYQHQPLGAATSRPGLGFGGMMRCVFRSVSAYLSLAEAQAGVDVLAVDPLQEAAAAVQHRLLLPRLEVAEQLIVHLHVAAVGISVPQRTSSLDVPLDPPTSLHSRTMGCVADGSGCVPKMADDVLLFLL